MISFSIASIVTILIYNKWGPLAILVGFLTFYITILVISFLSVAILDALQDRINKLKIEPSKRKILISIICIICLVSIGYASIYNMNKTGQTTSDITSEADPEITVTVSFPYNWGGNINGEFVDGDGEQVITVGTEKTVTRVYGSISNEEIWEGHPERGSTKIPIVITVKKGDKIIARESDTGTVFFDIDIDDKSVSSEYLKITNWTYRPWGNGLELNISGEIENMGNETIGAVYVSAKGYTENGELNPGSENETYIGYLEPGEKKKFSMILPDFGNHVLNSKKIDLRAFIK